jgi:hypothetical protein
MIGLWSRRRWLVFHLLLQVQRTRPLDAYLLRPARAPAVSRAGVSRGARRHMMQRTSLLRKKIKGLYPEITTK